MSTQLKKPMTDALTKAVVKNPRYANVKATLNTGSNERNFSPKFKPPANEPFNRISKQALFSLVSNAIVREENIKNVKDSDSVSVVTIDDDDTDSKSPYRASSYLLLDVRESDEYDACHIQTAISYPSVQLRRDQFPPQLFQFKNASDKTIVVYGTDEKSPTGRDAMLLFIGKHWDNVVLLTGGVKEFARAYPQLVLGAVPPTPATPATAAAAGSAPPKSAASQASSHGSPAAAAASGGHHHSRVASNGRVSTGQSVSSNMSGAPPTPSGQPQMSLAMKKTLKASEVFDPYATTYSSMSTPASSVPSTPATGVSTNSKSGAAAAGASRQKGYQNATSEANVLKINHNRNSSATASQSAAAAAAASSTDDEHVSALVAGANRPSGSDPLNTSTNSIGSADDHSHSPDQSYSSESNSPPPPQRALAAAPNAAKPAAAPAAAVAAATTKAAAPAAAAPPKKPTARPWK